MKKNSIWLQATGKLAHRKQRARRTQTPGLTIGMDLGDKTSRCCGLNGSGEMVFETVVATTRQAISQAFSTVPPCLVAIEVGTHSPWVSRLLASLGHEVVVANARQLKLISESTRKDDKLDARMLARVARVGPDLLRPIQHRSEEAQVDLLTIQVRATLIEMRTKAVNAARGLIKSFGERLPVCDADYLTEDKLKGLPQVLERGLQPLVKQIEELTERIAECEAQIEQIAARYPETALLEQVYGVGKLIALTYVLTVDDPNRFVKSRDAGCYVGLRPKRRDSGETQRQLGISKEGDGYLRGLLIQAAHCLLTHRAPDSDLKRWGAKLSGRGGRNARKRAIVAVARKLAVLLHKLWITGEVYEPLHNAQSAVKHKNRRRAAA